MVDSHYDEVPFASTRHYWNKRFAFFSYLGLKAKSEKKRISYNNVVCVRVTRYLIINSPIIRSLGLYVNLIGSEQSESEGRSNCMKTSRGEVIS